MIRQSGQEPNIIEYLKTPPNRDELLTLLEQLAITPRALLRSKEALVSELGLGDESVNDETLIDAMLANPILMNRPIVIGPKGTLLCRPCETVLKVLASTDIGQFTKENGQLIQPYPDTTS